MKTKSNKLNPLFQVLLSLVFLFMMACGGGGEATNEESDTQEENTEESADADQDSEASDAEDSEGSDALVSSEESSESLDYKSLQKYLPKSISGYEPDGDPKGQQLKIPTGSYSQTEHTFTKGDDQIDIVIGDYNLAAMQLTAMSAAWSMSYEDDETKAGGVKMKDGKVTGWEVYNKNDKEANLTLIVGSRFLVNIRADNQKDTEFVKSVAESLDLDALIKMGK